jgi:hypothetical protein
MINKESTFHCNRDHRRRRNKCCDSYSVCLAVVCNLTSAQTEQSTGKSLMEHDPRLTDFQVIEFRRYTIKEGQRRSFTQYFDTEALQQLGTIVAGSLLERKNQSGFIWIGDFHTFDDRAVLNGIFYNGSVWNEHRNTMNDLIDSTDDVLLLRPLSRFDSTYACAICLKLGGFMPCIFMLVSSELVSRDAS